ncbi:DMT family transporter [Nereida sp. MMG025]|uniref:DMT family transporter n=1 Tax=Nereida sp. MMG025 TaxID=2909981 RepID=UPI001F43322C|nr:DMT family transporter [Nereida sp. MMG025]MCF6443822.1 DMT family transporter [Nereida sp. MMG025]
MKADAIPDKPFLGILFMLGFCVMAPLGDGLAKYLGAQVSVLLLVVVRFGTQAIVLLPLSRVLNRSLLLTRRQLWLTFLRTVFHVIGLTTMFTSLLYLPLADALAIAFVMPFIMLLLGKFVLHEVVGPHRLAACTVGFIGTLLVIQPNFATVGWPALLPLVVAVAFALFMLVTRQIAKEVDAITLQGISGAMAIALLAPFLVWGALTQTKGLMLTAPTDPQTLWLLVALGLLGTVAHLAMTWSLRLAPSATVAPMQYLEIPFGTLIGWLLFQDLPNGLAALGIVITIAAGLYIIAREQATAKRLSQQRPQTPAPPAV